MHLFFAAASQTFNSVSDCGLQTVTFEIQHKPGYRLKIRAGFHSGAVVGGVVGTKIPHYSIFGDTVEIAGLMESAGLPMKVLAFC
jgi:class 3 adenylate cyclase